MIEQTAKANLFALVAAYRAATGLSLETVSRQIYGNRTFLAGLAKGENTITLPKIDLMLQAFANRWPKGVPWPKVVPLRMRRPRRAK